MINIILFARVTIGIAGPYQFSNFCHFSSGKTVLWFEHRVTELADRFISWKVVKISSYSGVDLEKK